MHPTLMTMFAEEHVQGLRSEATQRRSRVLRGGGHHRFFAFRLPRRSARVAHACHVTNRGYLDYMSMKTVEKTDAQWREELTPEQYQVLRKAATERAVHRQVRR